MEVEAFPSSPEGSAADTADYVGRSIRNSSSQSTTPRTSSSYFMAPLRLALIANMAASIF